MNFIVLTIFPELFKAFWENGIMRRAIENKTIRAQALNIRDHAKGRHHVTDDRPFGGGCGMVFKPEPLAGAVKQAKQTSPCAPVIVLSPQGRPFDQDTAMALAAEDDLILVCGRYEGIDERFCEQFADIEISIGDYVLTGGELPAMVVMDSVTRLIPGTLGNEDSAAQDSFSESRLDHAHYTRPALFEERTVPGVLMSGHHEMIAQWRMADSLMRTLVKRPDLLAGSSLSDKEIQLLDKWRFEIERIIKQQRLRGTNPSSGG
ncbi:MAG: tRNA (guanosine(37)-N1)-methyltransferase TrmD [Desulfobacteraceae bacterium]|nr:tRNA (guanosine(37)-N1)-methyltransferase TrmD [Desulfobacteraceae bacterium]